MNQLAILCWKPVVRLPCLHQVQVEQTTVAPFLEELPDFSIHLSVVFAQDLPLMSPYTRFLDHSSFRELDSCLRQLQPQVLQQFC